MQVLYQLSYGPMIVGCARKLAFDVSKLTPARS